MTGPLLMGAAFGLAIAAPLGPVSLICIQQSLNHGYRHGAVAGLGAATAHGIFASVAIAGASTVSAVMTPCADVIRLLSALILVGLGIRTIVRARRVATPSRAGSVQAVYASSFVVALSNPMTLVPYLALAAVVAEESTSHAGLSFWSVPGVMVATATWYACLSLVASSLRGGLTIGMARSMNLVAGGLLIGFGVLAGHGITTQTVASDVRVRSRAQQAAGLAPRDAMIPTTEPQRSDEMPHLFGGI